MTQDDDPKRLTGWELDQLRYSAEQRDIVDVAGKDLLALCDEVAEDRRKSRQPWAPAVILLPIGGAVAWLFSGDARWFGLGVLLLGASAAVGAALDGAKRGRR